LPNHREQSPSLTQSSEEEGAASSRGLANPKYQNSPDTMPVGNGQRR
jgi:hypothetical protein